MSWWLTQRIIYITLLFAIVVYATAFYRKLDRPYVFLLFLIIATFIFESIAIITAYNPPPRNDNSWVYEIFSPIQVLLVSITYYLILKNRNLKRLCIYMAGGVLLIIFYDYFFLDYKLSNINVVVRSILYLVFSLILMTDWLLKPGDGPITKEPAFWMNNGFFLFYTINILFWSIYKTEYFKSLELGKIFKKLLYFSNLTLYSLILLSFVLLIKRNDNGKLKTR